jgi:hypothetical protein
MSATKKPALSPEAKAWLLAPRPKPKGEDWRKEKKQ